MSETYPDIIRLYEEEGDFWLKERSKSPFFERKYLDWLVANAPIGSQVLDLGCGDGWPIASYIIEQGFLVTGVDGAKPMVEKAKARFPDHEWVLADMRTLALGKTFQAIVAWDSFFHLTRVEQAAMFAIFKSHLVAGGSLLFTAGPKNGEAIGDLNGKPLYHASLSPEEYRALLAKHGFQEVAFDPEDPDCGGHSVWRAKKK